MWEGEGEGAGNPRSGVQTEVPLASAKSGTIIDGWVSLCCALGAVVRIRRGMGIA